MARSAPSRAAFNRAELLRIAKKEAEAARADAERRAAHASSSANHAKEALLHLSGGVPFAVVRFIEPKCDLRLLTTFSFAFGITKIAMSSGHGGGLYTTDAGVSGPSALGSGRVETRGTSHGAHYGYGSATAKLAERHSRVVQAAQLQHWL